MFLIVFEPSAFTRMLNVCPEPQDVSMNSCIDGAPSGSVTLSYDNFVQPCRGFLVLC